MKINWDMKNIPSRLVWNRMKALRKERGLTQPQVAVGAGISITSVYYLELRYEARTTEKTKKKLAKFFKCDIEDLFPCEMIGNKPRAEYLKNIQLQKD